MPVRGEPLLPASSEFFPALLDSLLDAVVTIDGRGRITGYNHAAERLFGHPAANAVGQDVGLLIPLPYRREHGSQFDRYVATGRASILGRPQRVDGRRRDGSTFPCELAITEFTAGGERFFAGVVRELGAEERLMVARGEARLRNLIDSLAAFVAVYSPEGVMLDVNQAALDAGGIARTDAVGVRIDQTPWVAHSAATAAGVLQMVRRAAAGETIRSEIDIRVADGSVRYLDVILGPLRDPSGAVVEVLTSAIDITERRRAQDEVQSRLRQQEAVARLGVLALKTRDLPMLVTTGRRQGPTCVPRRRGPVPAERRQHPRGRRPERPDGIAASAGARVLGNDVREPPRPDRARRRAGHAGAVERRPRAPHRLQRRRDRAPPHAGVHRRRRAGGVHEQGGRSVRGRPRHARRARPGPQRRPDAGAVLGPAILIREQPHLLGIALDISDRRRLEEQLRHSQKMEALGRLAGGVAHDFNNLLTVITGFGGLTLSALAPDDPNRVNIEEIVQAADSAASLTRQLLAFSRRTMIEPVVLDLNGVVADMETLLRRVIGEDVQLATALDPALRHVRGDVGSSPFLPNPLHIDLDAAYATAHPGTVPGPYASMIVTDTGTGMSADVQARAFEPFFTTKGVGRGSGLGLSVVHGIAEQSGARIELASEVGEGTTFTIHFPAVAEPVAVRTPAPAESLRGSGTILLVEDEDGVRKLARMILERHGYAVLDCAHGEEALRLLERYAGPLDLIVTDVVMPGLDGGDVAKAVKRRFPAAKVLFLSGYTSDAVVRHGILHHEVAFLQKPFSAASLATKVRDVLLEP